MGAVRRFKQPEIKVRNGAKIRDLKGQGNNFPTRKLTPIVALFLVFRARGGAGPVFCSSWVCASVNSLLRGLVTELPYRRSLVVAPFQATAAVYTVHCKEGVRS